MNLVCIGLSHRTAPVEIREKVAFTDAEATAFLAENVAGTPEAVLLSTCNRTELYVRADDSKGLAERLARRLDAARGTTAFADTDRRYEYEGREAALHLMRVACGLDSMVLGEAQILGQVEHALDLARRSGRAGAALTRLVESAIRLGGKVRAETDIGRGVVSIGSAAVGLATKIFGSLEGRTALVVGAGEMGTLAARHLRAAGVESLVIANRTVAKAEALATEVSGRGLPLCGVPAELTDVDVVVSAIPGGEPLLTRVTLRGAMKARGYRPLLIVDVAVPRSVDPDVNSLENVFLQDIDALRSIIDANLARRQKAAKAVDVECAGAADRYVAWTKRLAVDPTLRDLRRLFDDTADRELARTLKKVPDRHHADVERLARSLVNKLLHAPTERLREGVAEGNGVTEHLATLRDVFGLEERHEDQDRDEG